MAPLRRLHARESGVRRRVEVGARGAEQMLMRGALAGRRAYTIAARQIFGGKPPPGAGGIEHGEGALRARGENVVPGKARRTDPHLHRQALFARSLAPPAAAGDDAVLSRALGLKAVGR